MNIYGLTNTKQIPVTRYFKTSYASMQGNTPTAYLFHMDYKIRKDYCLHHATLGVSERRYYNRITQSIHKDLYMWIVF